MHAAHNNAMPLRQARLAVSSVKWERAYHGPLPAALRSGASALAAEGALVRDTAHLHACLHECPLMASAVLDFE